MSTPRLFLIAPEAPVSRVLACLAEACAAGDVASLLLPPTLAAEVTPAAQVLGCAVLLAGDLADVRRFGCDGLHVAAGDHDIRALRAALGTSLVLGVDVASSRHLAMEAAEGGADYLALDQNGPTLGGETILAWSTSLLEVPAVAIAPTTVADLDTLLPQNPDFIRPPDAMWDDEAAARHIVGQLDEALKRR